MKHLALTTLVVWFPCFGQIPSNQTTVGQRNGRFWNLLSTDSKLLYVLALQEGFDLGHTLGRSSVLNRVLPWTETKTTEQRIKITQEGYGDEAADQRVYFPDTLTFGEIVKGLDRLYEAPENLILPVVEGLEIFAMKANGADQEKVDSKLAGFRRRNIQEVEEEQKKKAIQPKPPKN